MGVLGGSLVTTWKNFQQVLCCRNKKNGYTIPLDELSSLMADKRSSLQQFYDLVCYN